MTQSPRFIQGVFPFEGRGLDQPAALPSGATYSVPPDRRAQLIYFRGGNSCDELICVTLTRDAKVMRHFPIGAKGAIHVPLAVVEDVFPETRLGVLVAAPKGAAGWLALDVGIVEVE